MSRPKKVIQTQTQKEQKKKVLLTEQNRKKSIAKVKESFSFGGMTKEERLNIINNALNAKPTSEPYVPWTVDETEYVPESWVVVINAKGQVYQEPVPRYCDVNYFISLLAAMPDKLDKTATKFIMSADEVCKTEFKVKGVDCYINTVAFNGTRTINHFSNAFEIRNVTRNVGGNLVFSSLNEGFTKAQCKKVIEAIVKKLNENKEIITV